MNHRLRTVSEFVQSNKLLYSWYLLHSETWRGEELNSDRSFALFLTWFILTGRQNYRGPLVLPDEVREAIVSPDQSGLHPLVVGAVGRVPQSRDGGKNQLAVYAQSCIEPLKLGPFVGRGEARRLLRALGRAAAANGVRYPQSASDRRRLIREGGELLEILVRLASADPIALPSVTIVGFHRSILGLGEDARNVFECLIDSGVKTELIDISPPELEKIDNPERYEAFEARSPSGSVVIFCLPPFEMMRAICRADVPAKAPDQIWIGYWPWETSALAQDWLHVFDYVDEVWASSRFLETVYRRQTQKPVRLVPPLVAAAEPTPAEELSDLLSGGFIVTSFMDFNSRIERKNPLGSVAAFRKAFPRGDEPALLVLKTLHADMQSQAFGRLREAIGGDERIVLIDGALSRGEVAWLIANSDVFLSLHRAEGFGRPVAEAMLLGTPVISTGWSGTADFVHETTGYPVKFKLRTVAAEEYPFAAGTWAEPDVDHAATLLSALYAAPRSADDLKKRAEAQIKRLYGQKHVTKALAGHLLRLKETFWPASSSG